MNFFYRLSHRAHFLILCTLLGGLFALVVSLLLPQEYRSTARLLVIQLQSPSLDAYAASKSSERLAQTLSRVVSTDSFYHQVAIANPAVQSPYLDHSEKRRKAWIRSVEVSQVPETGILEISAYDKDRVQSALLAQTVSFVLTQHGADYHGGGDQVIIREIDPPLASTFPARPPILWNTLGGFATGSFISLFVWWWFLPAMKNRTVHAAVTPFSSPSPTEVLEIRRADPEPAVEVVSSMSTPRPEVVSLFDHLSSDLLTGELTYGGEVVDEEELG
ncbi:MAG: Wzz/FepE/Etk N-terminal domain-containing protein [Patescibacteria group bacterium]